MTVCFVKGFVMSFELDRADGTDIHAPLLQKQPDSAATESCSEAFPADGATPGAIDARQNGFCEAVAAAWKLILDVVKAMFCRVAALLAVIVPFTREAALTERQEEKMRELRCRAQVAFDGDMAEHLDALKELWQIAFPSTPWTGQRSEKWKEMGWQGMDPATDFRGGGFLALQMLLELHKLRPVLFRKLMHKTEGVRSKWEYPFAVAGVNITFALTEMLQLRTSQAEAPFAAHTRGFLHLMETEENAFSQIFCIMFALLDRKWLDMSASYMEFPLVMKQTRQRIEEALANRPKNLNELQTLLGLPHT